MSNLLAVSDFHYQLPPSAIAYYPSENRDQSRLLFYNKGHISDHIFLNISELLPQNSLLVRNNSAVLPCRLFFPYIHKGNHKKLECFILSSPNDPQWQNIHHSATTKLRLNCYLRPFYPDLLQQELCLEFTLKTQVIQLKAQVIQREQQTTSIEFSWNSQHSFGELLFACANPPLPPYIKRAANSQDSQRYQNIYAQHWGSVAAPTAGLHFSEKVLANLPQRGINTLDLCLHINADTFKPMRCQFLNEHQIHGEFFQISQSNLQKLLATTDPIISVGTTAMRSLESIYYLGCKAYLGHQDLHILKQEEIPNLPQLSPKQAINELLNFLLLNNLATLQAHTFLFIYPPRKIQISQGLITNFHQPSSTLLALCAAFIGTQWHNVYQHALAHNYRFLSYGDSSLLIP